VGVVQRSIVNYLLASEVNAVGLTAGDGGLIRAKKLMISVDKKEIDIGLVGEVSEVNADVLRTLLEFGFLPVISPLANDDEGNVLNINADLVAGAIGGAYKQTK
jgi:acetylglutamate kinase